MVSSSTIAREAVNLFLKELKKKGPDFSEKALKSLKKREKMQQQRERQRSIPDLRDLPRLDYAEFHRTGIKKYTSPSPSVSRIPRSSNVSNMSKNNSISRRSPLKSSSIVLFGRKISRKSRKVSRKHRKHRKVSRKYRKRI